MERGGGVAERSPEMGSIRAEGSNPSPVSSKPDMAALRAIAAGNGLNSIPYTRELPDRLTMLAVQCERPDVGICAYKEYDQDTGETMACGLVKHSMKQKHGAWRRV